MASRRRLKRLDTEREKLLRAHCAGAVDLEPFDRERKRISAEEANAEAQLAAAEERLTNERATLELARAFTSDMWRAYQAASPLARRCYNHAFFEAVYVQDRRILRVERRAPFNRVARSRRR